ncbi:helix-turn-helix domain-containing protein [Gemmata sp.]|uniref:helix-turn-helix domain-containing protein n=1 Tax=Gemmata sp. TaxID=1914242 RepID=UPI003F71AEF8
MSTSPIHLTVSQIVARLPGSRGANRLHPATVTRWILAGCRARDGRRVKLAATRAGSRWLVREADLEAFFDALGAEPPAVPVPTVNTSRAESRSAAAALELQRRGA